MSLRYKGGVISATPPTTTGGTSGTAPGVWTLEQQMQAQAASLWPVPPPPFGAEMRSLRFNSADSAYLNRTPASAGNRKTWTWSSWVKRGRISGSRWFVLATNNTGGSNAFYFEFNSSDQLNIGDYTAGNFVWQITTTQVFRDPSSWYHIVLAFDSTQATTSNRVKLYINGSQVTAFSIATYPSLNYDSYINSVTLHTIGDINGAGLYFNGYMTEVVFVDGQALTPSSFGQTNSTTGVWEPKAITGLTYGTNGFYLKFQDNSGTTSTTLGKDSSGNSNNWTPNNFSVTAGTGNDSLVDTPYPYGTDTGVGGEVRGNYGTLNPLASNSSFTFANGNLDVSYTVSNSYGTRGYGSFAAPSGKWYFEATITAVDSGALMCVGVGNPIGPTTANPTNSTGYNDVSYRADGAVLVNGVSTSYSSYTTNDVIGIAIDVDAGKVWVAKNNTWQNSGVPASGTGAVATGLTGSLAALFRPLNGSMVFNFGQRPFAYTAPSGFKALVTQNLSTPTVIQGDDYFNTVLYTGNGSTQSITGVGFQPDFVWIKSRSGATDHGLYDAVRGVQKQIESNTSTAETTETTGLTAFGTDGFTVGALAQLNTSTATYVGWNWKANGAGSSNTQGTITSTVSANTTSGFSVVTYTGTGSSASVGHGLGAAPQMIIVKGRTNSVAWVVYSIGLTAGYEIYLNASNAQAVSSNFGSAPTSTVFNLGTDTNANGNGITYVAYCWAPISGFSAFGKYTGNGSTNGPFIYTGFRPAFVIIKLSSDIENWTMWDSVRSAFNVTNERLYPNLTAAETESDQLDFVSNGFKIVDTNSQTNVDGGTYIYMAFAQNPFKYALAR